MTLVQNEAKKLNQCVLFNALIATLINYNCVIIDQYIFDEAGYTSATFVSIYN